MSEKTGREIWILSTDKHFCDSLSACLRDTPLVGTEIKIRHPAEALTSVSSSHPQGAPFLIFVDLAAVSGDPGPGMQALVKTHPSSYIVATNDRLDVDSVLALLKKGVRDFIKKPVNPEEIKALVQKIVEAQKSSSSLAQGKVVAFYSPKGGTGVTLIAVNLAVTLVKKFGLKVALVDLSTGFGNAAAYLGLKPEYTIRDLVENSASLDESMIAGVALRHTSGVDVIACPHYDRDPVSTAHLKEIHTILDVMKRMYDMIIVDVGHRDLLFTQAVLIQAHEVQMVTSMDIPSVNGIFNAFMYLKKLKNIVENVKIVINRYDAKNQVDVVGQLEKAIQQPVAFKLSNDYAACIDAINAGKPICDMQGHGRFEKEIALIADDLAGSKKESGASAAGFLSFLHKGGRK